MSENTYTTEVVEPQGLDFGPVTVDSERLGPELFALAAIMVMLVAFKWAMKTSLRLFGSL